MLLGDLEEGIMSLGGIEEIVMLLVASRRE